MLGYALLALVVAATAAVIVPRAAGRLGRLPAVSTPRAAALAAVVTTVLAFWVFRRPPLLLAVGVPWGIGAAIGVYVGQRRLRPAQRPALGPAQKL